jgi:transketolase
MPEENIDYKALATRIRVDILRMVHRARSGHIGSSLSVADILAVLYGRILNVDPARPDWPERDRFILSKGHGASAVYAALSERGFFPREWLQNYYQNDSYLPGHITHSVPGVEASTGALGHGLPIGSGMAMAAKYDDKKYRVYVVLSDGDCDEGSTWEAALFAHQHRLDNVVAIVDYNRIQGFGRTAEVLDLEPLAEKWRSFGWAVREIDGHNHEQIEEALLKVPFEPERPSCIVAHTIKGKGVSFMEDQVAWHYRSPDDKQLREALHELGVSD